MFQDAEHTSYFLYDVFHWFISLFSSNDVYLEPPAPSPTIFWIKFGLFIFGVIAAALIIYLLILHERLSDLQRKKLLPKEKVSEKSAADEKKGRLQSLWADVLGRLSHESEAEWRVAILEADSILDDMLKDLGYPGETIADRLKVIKRDNLKTVDLAWEAHKTRNRIAHDGSAFVLTRPLAEHTLNLYRQIFDETGYI